MFLFSPQLPPVMSQKKRFGLSKEELEIQQVLSPSNSQSTLSDAPPAPGQKLNEVSLASASLSAECMRDLASMLTKSMVEALNQSGSSRSRSRRDQLVTVEQDDYASDQWSDGEVIDVELPTGRPSVASGVAPSFFGVGINEPDHLRDHGYNKPDAQAHLSADPPPGVAQPQAPAVDLPLAQGDAPAPTPVVAPVPVPVVLPDEGLPMPSSRHPTNWSPHPEVLAWASLMVDTCEWSAADREAMEKRFSPASEHDHLFTAVPAPPDMLAALKHPRTKELDYLFKRFETENHLYTANQDLSCGFRPLLEVISNLRGVPGMDQNRELLGYVFQSMASSTSHLSRGRRELGRRFVPLSNATALFRKKPSHLCLFGDTSIDKAVQEAVAASKVNKDLVMLPKKQTQQPFRGFSNAGKSQYRGRYQPYRQPYSGGKRGKFQYGQKGRGRGSRKGKGQHQQAKSSQE